MNSLFIILLIPAIASIVLPIYSFLTKPSISKTNMSLLGAQVIIGLTFFFYACRFNDYLVTEYLLNFAFSILALFAAPLFYIFTCSLTQPEGLTKKNRQVLFLPITMTIILSAMSLICSLDDCRHYAIQVLYFNDFSFIPGNPSYNLLIIIAYFTFYIAFTTETIIIVFVCIRKIDSYIKLLKEHYSTNEMDIVRNKYLLMNCVISLATIILLLILKVIYFESTEIFWVIAISTTISQVHFAWYGHTHTKSAEQITHNLNTSDIQYPSISSVKRGKNQPNPPTYNTEELFTYEVQEELYSAPYYLNEEKEKYQQITEHLLDLMEKDEAYLDPNITLASLSDTLKINQRDLVKIINEYNDLSFSEYIDQMRIQKSVKIILDLPKQESSEKVKQMAKERSFIVNLATECGYTNSSAFMTAFSQVMGVSYEEWLEEI